MWVVMVDAITGTKTVNKKTNSKKSGNGYASLMF